MVSTTQIKPAPVLQPFISCYALRIFNTGPAGMPRPLHAVQEYYMNFYLREKYCAVVSDSGEITSGISNCLTTLLTKSYGYSYWKGDYVLLSVQFQSNGLFAIFGIPQRILINNVLALDCLMGNDSGLITEQLVSCKGIYEMGEYLNTYFTKKLLQQKHKQYTDIIAQSSKVILQQKGIISLDALAYYANMSIRTFERRFLDEVGMTPKLYARITRFYNAVDNKVLHPYKSFTAIAHESGYYDQAHFIKECREFANKTPEELFKYTPPPTEQFVAKVNY